MFIFAKAIVEGMPIKLFNHGQMSRDFTYVDDVAEAIVRLIDRPPAPGQPASTDPLCSAAPWKINNIGNFPSSRRRLVVLQRRNLFQCSPAMSRRHTRMSLT